MDSSDCTGDYDADGIFVGTGEVLNDYCKLFYRVYDTATSSPINWIMDMPIMEKSLNFIRFGFLKISLRFKHFIYYLKHNYKKIKGFMMIIVIIKMMFCNKLLYIKRKINKK